MSVTKEKKIKDACERKLLKEGWVPWFVHKKMGRIRGGMTVAKLCDIHTIYDCLAMRGNEVKLIQFTSVPAMSARRKKIAAYYKTHKLTVPCEIWGYYGFNKWEIEIYPPVDN